MLTHRKKAKKANNICNLLRGCAYTDIMQILSGVLHILDDVYGNFSENFLELYKKVHEILKEESNQIEEKEIK